MTRKAEIERRNRRRRERGKPSGPLEVSHYEREGVAGSDLCRCYAPLRPCYVRDVAINLFGRISDKNPARGQVAGRSPLAGWGVPVREIERRVFEAPCPALPPAAVLREARDSLAEAFDKSLELET